MNDLFSAITGILTHAYLTACFIYVIGIPPRMLIRSLRSKSPI